MFECLTIGSKASTDFVEERLNNKSKQLLDTLSRNWKRPQKPVDSKEKDVRKETMQFCKNVDITRTRKYSIHKLLSFEMCETSFFLTKDGYISKTNKSELTRELEKIVKYVPHVSRRPENPETLCEVTIIDFSWLMQERSPLQNLCIVHSIK